MVIKHGTPVRRDLMDSFQTLREFSSVTDQCSMSLSCYYSSAGICQWNVQHLTDNKLEEIRAMLRQPSNDQDRLDIRILSDTFCSHKVPDSFYGIYGLQFHRKERQAVDKSIKERVLKHNMVGLFLPYKTRSFFEGQEDKVDFVFRIFSGSGARFFKRSCRRTKIPWGRRRGNI